MGDVAVNRTIWTMYFFLNSNFFTEKYDDTIDIVDFTAARMTDYKIL